MRRFVLVEMLSYCCTNNAQIPCQPEEHFQQLPCFFYSSQSYALAKYWIHSTARFCGVHAESRPIWTKSGAL